MNLLFFRLLLTSVFLGFILIACSGGESGTGITGGHSKVSMGVITGFGSVYVNGVEFDTSKAQVNLNDTVASEQDLSIGMVVAVVGSTNLTQSRGSADAIYYETEVRGIVQSNSDALLTIMGQAISYDDETIFENNVGTTVTLIKDIPSGAVVEVSGYRTGDNALHATQLVLVSTEYSVGEELIVKGTISGVAEGEFSMGDLTVAIDSATQFDGIPNQQLVTGMEISVKSNRGIVYNKLLADNIKLSRSQYATSGIDVEVEAIVTNPDLQAKEFLLNGYTVYYSDQTEFEGGTAADLADGVKAEVEGVLISDKQLEAKEIKYQERAELLEIASVTSVNTDENQVNVSGVMVQLTSRTLLIDDAETDIKQFSILDINSDDRVEIIAYPGELANEIVATQLKRIDTQSSDPTYELKGVLEQFTDTEATLSGITVDRSRIVEPELKTEDLGKVITIKGTVPITVQ